MISVGLLSVSRAEEVCAMQVQHETINSMGSGWLGGRESHSEWHVMAMLASGDLAVVAQYKTSEAEAVEFMLSCASTLGLSPLSALSVVRLSVIDSLYVSKGTRLFLVNRSFLAGYEMDIMIVITVPKGLIKFCVKSHEDPELVAKTVAECRAKIDAARPSKM